MLEIPQQTQTDRQADRRTYIMKEREKENERGRAIAEESDRQIDGYSSSQSNCRRGERATCKKLSKKKV